jgi:hypothetical protein
MPGTWHSFQRYYVRGLRTLRDVRFRYLARVDSALADLSERGWRGTHRAWTFAAKFRRDERSPLAADIGRYTFEFANRAMLKVAIDTHDAREICDQAAYEWSDLYFKVSYWPRSSYGTKVRPLICGHGALDDARISRLVGMRDHARDLDLVLIAKLWPGKPTSPTYWNPVEHLVRVFEILAKLKIRSHLCALVPPLSTAGPFPSHFLQRLANAGVAVKHSVSIEELWSATASSRLAFLRPGKHLGVSWRLIDHLAMGACTLCDRAPYPEWPQPLRVGRELLECECGIDEDESLPSNTDYERIADTVMDLLGDPRRADECRRSAAQYFDQYVTPSRIARHLVQVADEYSRLSAGPVLIMRSRGADRRKASTPVRPPPRRERRVNERRHAA